MDYSGFAPRMMMDISQAFLNDTKYRLLTIVREPQVLR